MKPPKYARIETQQAFQRWLFGSDVTNTIIIFKRTGITILTSSKKIVYFRPLSRKRQHRPKITFIQRSSSDSMKKLVSWAIKGTRGCVLGVFDGRAGASVI